MSEEKISRKQQILLALAEQLERHPGKRITTAALAEAVGVSEAALYRHFPSKARMFEGLLEFTEEAIFARINRILEEESHAVARCEKVLVLMLGFSARNPGITRVLTGDALVGETDRLHQRVGQFFNRLETQLKQILREGSMRDGLDQPEPAGSVVALLLAVIVGRMQQYVQSGFHRSPIEDWENQWPVLMRGVFV